MKESPALRMPLAAAALLFAVLGTAGSARAEDSAAAFRALAADYLQEYYEVRPVRATQLGIHDHDSQLPDLSRRAVARRTEALHDWLGRLDAVDPARLPRAAAYDREILDHAIRAELLELEEIRGWQHNPMVYNRVIADAVASLIDREFAPLEQRMDSLLARLDELPRVIAACKKNMRDVPELWAELAVQNARGTLGFLEQNVPGALEAQGLAGLDDATLARWERERRRATRRLARFVEWLENDLQPRAHGDFRLGRELFERKLLYEEHLDLSVDELVAMNEAAIEAYRARMEHECRRIDPATPCAELIERIAHQHPDPADLIPTAREYVEAARDFVVEHDIVTLPSTQLPLVRPTPAYARMGFASMSTPGPFEDAATEAYYNITGVDPSWNDEQCEQHLTYFNRPGLLGISIHEAMPGHYVQLLYQRELPTDLRKVFAPASLVEGWAHYTEQMMIDEGFGDGDPAVRLGQLRRALQRHARWYAGVALHTTDVSLEQAARRFAEIAYFEPFPALRETRRATYNPTYLYYALGRMEILALRDDYRRHTESLGETFSLRAFHDRFLRLGLPIPMAREVLLRSEAGGPEPAAAD